MRSCSRETMEDRQTEKKEAKVYHGAGVEVMKNCEPFVLRPKLAFS